MQLRSPAQVPGRFDISDESSRIQPMRASLIGHTPRGYTPGVAMRNNGRPADIHEHMRVMPRFESDQRWNAFQVSDDPPSVSLVGPVASYEDARQRAARSNLQLRVEGRAWQQMVAAGVAPPRVPDSVLIV